jgi:hypothetical protein
MKKGLLILLSSVLVSSLMANEVELQVVAGKNFPDHDKLDRYDYGTNLGVRSNFFLSTDNALQLAYDKIEGMDCFCDDEDVHRYSVNYLHISRDNGSSAHPFILFGGGYEDGVNKNQGFFDAGFGATISISKNINLVGEIKGIKKNVDNDFDINTNIGLGLKLGQEPQNKIVKVDCVTEKMAPRLVKRRVVIPRKAMIIDDKINCVR